MATRLINIPRLDIDAKKSIKTKQNIMSSDYCEIYITLYENGQPKPFSPNTQFKGYGILYKSKQEINPILNSQFTIINSELGQLCLLLTPQETVKDEVLMLQIKVTDNESSIEGHNHGLSNFCTQYFLITISKSQNSDGVSDGSAIVGTFNVGTRRVGEGLVITELINEVKEEVTKGVEQNFVKEAMFEDIREQKEQDEVEKEIIRNTLREVIQNIEKDVKKEVVQELLKENKQPLYELEEFETSSISSALSDKFKKKLKKSR